MYSPSLITWIALGLLVLLVLAWIGIHLAVAISTYMAMRWPYGFSRQKGDLTCARCGYDLRASPDQCPECGGKVGGIHSTLVRYMMRVDQLDQIEARRKARGEA